MEKPSIAGQLAEVRRLTASGQARCIRLSAGLSQAEIAASMAEPVTASAIARWESGSRRPRGDAAIAYLEALRELERAG